jgi:hypothetical protein
MEGRRSWHQRWSFRAMDIALGMLLLTEERHWHRPRHVGKVI